LYCAAAVGVVVSIEFLMSKWREAEEKGKFRDEMEDAMRGFAKIYRS